ncbi:hypothetical protein ACSBLW_18870 [Thioclava sp. FR2]|uniref:hypothetical protein n=1 Tax=Thioclava sp. FR2 TaxID=3445780 RepID=UPI003EBAA56E
MTTLLSPKDFSVAAANGSLSIGECAIQVDESEELLPIKVIDYAPESRNVCYAFHGAINQEIRNIPLFYGNQFLELFPKRMTIISIADPSLRLSREALYTWYAGDEKCPTQKMISALVTSVNETVRPEKTIFIGGSSGAHPALYHSHSIPDSLCLTVNPLPRIAAYETVLQQYLKLCWPNGHDVAGRRFKDNVIDLYSSGYRNKVVILQNSTDPHMQHQILPLVKSLSHQKQDYLFLSEFFPDHLGHRYPAGPLNNWVEAALKAESFDLWKMADTVFSKRATSEPVPAQKSKTAEPGFSQNTVQLADRISAHFIGDAK